MKMTKMLGKYLKQCLHVYFIYQGNLETTEIKIKVKHIACKVNDPINMNESQKHWAKTKKQVTQEYVKSDYIYML